MVEIIRVTVVVVCVWVMGVLVMFLGWDCHTVTVGAICLPL